MIAFRPVFFFSFFFPFFFFFFFVTSWTAVGIRAVVLYYITSTYQIYHSILMLCICICICNIF